MLRAVGYEVIHYGVEGAESGATEQVDVLTQGVWRALGGEEPGAKQIGEGKADAGSLLYWEFNRCLVPLLRARAVPGDVICCPFGTAHLEAMRHFPDVFVLETGIGYPVTFAQHRVFESLAWLHYHLGKQGQRDGVPSGLGSDYDFVIPNYFDPSEWKLGTGAGGYLCYFGRLNWDKGLPIVLEIAKARPDLKVILCGQGDPTPWLTEPNIEARPPIHGAGRDELLGNALAVLCPSRYVEPFGGVAIEANLCGTPVLASDFGAFTETVHPGWNGYRCRTLGIGSRRSGTWKPGRSPGAGRASAPWPCEPTGWTRSAPAMPPCSSNWPSSAGLVGIVTDRGSPHEAGPPAPRRLFILALAGLIFLGLRGGTAPDPSLAHADTLLTDSVPRWRKQRVADSLRLRDSLRVADSLHAVADKAGRAKRTARQTGR
jgi:hypothetical protein